MFHKRLIALLACVVLGALIAVPASAGAQASPTDCGPAVAKGSGGEWTCTFADDFTGRSLDRSKWSVMTTATTGFTHAYECYVDDPSTVAVLNGSLRLTARELESPQPCGALFVSPYQSGMVHTKDLFAQTYGRFQARIKFPRGRGFHSAWWMWPSDEVYGERSGEVDIAEHYGSYPSIVSPYVHIKDGRTERGDGAYCNVNWAESTFHTYTVEWLPLEGFRFLYDNRVCMTFNDWDPGLLLAHPQPFDQPFFLILTLALDWGENSVTASTPFPANMWVDYVRAWS